MTLRWFNSAVGEVGGDAKVSQLRRWIHQILMIILINVPTVSFGLAMGWVSLASGEGGIEQGMRDVVVAAAITFVAQLVGVGLSARALAAGRKPALILTSLAFAVCWALKLVGGGWWIMMARAAAGLGGAGAWTLAPLLAREMCQSSIRGAAVSALVLAHNVGFLIMYLVADARLDHTTVLWCCLGMSATHCCAVLFMPESPSFLAASGKLQEACSSLAWLRGVRSDDTSEELKRELRELPAPETDEPHQSPLTLAREMLSDWRRRRAFFICLVAVVGQEACGVYALLQFAEHVFVLARDKAAPASVPLATASTPTPALFTPARHAVLLGVVQLLTSAVALYLVEKLGRRPLLVWTSALTALSLGAAAALVQWGGSSGGGTLAAVALAAAVAADSAGMQPVPYALLAEMFNYKYRGCAVLVVTAAACIGNALEVGYFAAAMATGGVCVALWLSAALTAAYALYAALAVPETKNKDPQQIQAEFRRNKWRRNDSKRTSNPTPDASVSETAV